MPTREALGRGPGHHEYKGKAGGSFGLPLSFEGGRLLLGHAGQLEL